MTDFSPLCQFNSGCFGCCGRDFGPKEKIISAITINTEEFKKSKDLIEFRQRFPPSNLLEGVCRNLIFHKGKIICPLHPKANKGKDLRIGHCDYNFLCQTAGIFNAWPKEKQERFLDFIKKLNLDPIDYSLKMEKGILLKDFLQSEEDKGQK